MNSLKKEKLFLEKLPPTIILNNMPTMIFSYDLNHRIIWANKAVCNYFKLPLEELKGKLCYKLWDKKELTQCEHCALTETIIHSKSQTKNIIDAKNRTWNSRTLPVFNKNNHLVEIVEIRIDVTELEKLGKDRKRIIELLEENIVSFYSLIDGIRNPLTVILGLSELRDTQLHEQICAEVQKIVNTLNLVESAFANSLKTIQNIKDIEIEIPNHRSD
ncbi:MAG: PAS domain-containing protein [Candidatus Heimdallarchaeaceae archaeon]